MRPAPCWCMVVDPLSLGVLKRPGELGADVVVAEGQSLGSPMQFGGPYLGIMACREKFVRRLPGRIAGQTVDRRGRRCWVLTLQTREQHIRREKATSNICTNQGLFALRAAIYLTFMGPHGLRDVGELCVRKAHFAAECLTAGDRLERRFAATRVQGICHSRYPRPSAGTAGRSASRRASWPASPWDDGTRNCPIASW